MKHIRTWMTAFLGLAAVAGLSACTAGNTNTLSEGGRMAPPPPIEVEEIIGDPGLVKRVYVYDIVDGTNTTGRRKVQVKFFNNTPEFQTIGYSVKWLDDQGFDISSQSEAWRNLGIPATASESVTLVAPRDEAMNWQLRTRRSR